MAKSSELEISTSGKLHVLTFRDTEHRPSWRNHGSGWSSVKITAHSDGKWLEINSREVAEGKRPSEKYTMTTLDEAAARHLYTMLKTIFE